MDPKCVLQFILREKKNEGGYFISPRVPMFFFCKERKKDIRGKI